MTPAEPTTPPDAWFWAHDSKPAHVASLLTAGMRLIRLSAYGSGVRRRFAALMHHGVGAQRDHALDLDVGALAAYERPVAITVGEGEPLPRFSLVFEHGPGSPSAVHVDLDAAKAQALAADEGGIIDVATYLVDGQRRYAVITGPGAAPAWLITDVTMPEMRDRLARLDATPSRLRAHTGGDEPRFTAVARPDDGAHLFWYVDLDADQVARHLERNRAYPVDLDGTRGADGVRFTVVMRG